jgi:hypothetical protein
LGALSVPSSVTGYTPTQFGTQTWGTPQTEQYMNPYMENILTPQLDMARRQSEITNLGNNTAATKAGAFGGSRQALMTSENQRALGDTMAGITGKAYDTAYTTGMGQFNADQNRLLETQRAGESSRQFGSAQGLAGLNAQMNLNKQMMETGATQRDIEQQALNAQKAQFEEERDAPYKMVQYQQSLLQGLPISAQTNDYADPSMLQQSKDAVATMLGLYETMYGKK